MAKKQQKKKVGTKQPPLPRPKEFLDLIAPAAVQFNTDSFILGGTYRSVMVLRSYPPTTEQLALLSQLGELGGVTLHLTARQVTAAEENAILHTATNKSRMERGNLNNMKQSVTAEAKLQDVAALINTLRREQEPLLHCSVFLELSANSAEQLRTLRDQVNAMLLRAKLRADPLFLRQRDGFLSSNPAGHNVFGAFAERVLPASSVANLYPMSYSGKTDPCGFYLGNEKYGSNIIVDLDRRTGDKTNASALILGNSGQGKSYLLKFLLCNVLESGKSVRRNLDADWTAGPSIRNSGCNCRPLQPGQSEQHQEQDSGRRPVRNCPLGHREGDPQELPAGTLPPSPVEKGRAAPRSPGPGAGLRWEKGQVGRSGGL